MSTIFGLMRHATTQWNLEKRIQGQSDIPLSEQGRVEAGAWEITVPDFSWDRILSSDLMRARQTADIVNSTLHLPHAMEPRLREQNWGEWEGRTLIDIKKKEGAVLKEKVSAGWAFCPPGGEERYAVWQRCRFALLAASQQWPGRHILIVAHEGVLKCVLYRLLNRRFLPAEGPVLKPGYLHLLQCEHDTLTLIRVNAAKLNRTDPV
ncbi:MAG: histidine phosphatase family protein [Desulfobacteraceae bacterium]|nr:histidine phosphatase family protein [Desulfobacteraceae bacterium]